MAKPITTYTPTTKNRTTFGAVAKKPTSFNRNSSVASWLLNSTVVTLNSTLYLLSGYTGATPSQLNNKNATTFTAV